MPIRNLAAVKAKLAKLPPGVQVAVKKANEQNADDMVGLAQRLVPRRTGALAASIGKEAGGTDLSVQVVAGNSEAFYARFVEFGTRSGTAGETADFSKKQTLERGTEGQSRSRKVKRTHPGTPAQPFFFPAYRALRRSMKSKVTRASNKAIKDAVSGGGGGQ